MRRVFPGGWNEEVPADGAGPTPVPSHVLLAMAQPMIHHRTPEYEALFVEIRAGLKRLFQTTQDVIPLACSGTGAMEAAVVNTLSAGDTVAVVQAGQVRRALDRDRPCLRASVIEMSAPFGETVSPERVAETLQGSPGDQGGARPAQRVLDRRAARRARLCGASTRDTDVLLIVDAVSSLGIADLEMDAWGVDVVVAGSQKGLMLPPGLAFCALPREAWAKTLDVALPKYYFDLAAERDFARKNEAHFTPAVGIMLGLREVLRMLDAEGLGNVFLPP